MKACSLVGGPGGLRIRFLVLTQPAIQLRTRQSASGKRIAQRGQTGADQPHTGIRRCAENIVRAPLPNPTPKPPDSDRMPQRVEWAPIFQKQICIIAHLFKGGHNVQTGLVGRHVELQGGENLTVTESTRNQIAEQDPNTHTRKASTTKQNTVRTQGRKGAGGGECHWQSSGGEGVRAGGR